MKILIIEDETIIAMDLARLLYSLGAKEVKIVASAEEGLSWLSDRKPDLIIVDIKLRGSMDGLQATRIIQKKGPFHLVYLTAYNDEIILKEAKDIPNLGVVIKPFTPNEILNLFSKIIS
ncbi:MAG: response regulator [Candidatus Aminicenantes bacterium]|nr:response regulator [Candidatus Aminicenantes bacterium]